MFQIVSDEVLILLGAVLSKKFWSVCLLKKWQELLRTERKLATCQAVFSTVTDKLFR